MITVKKQIKVCIILFSLIFTTNLYSQKEAKKHNLFLRVYNLEDKKIAKGRIIFINDSVLGLRSNGKKFELSFKDISLKETKRSLRHNVISGTLFGANLGAIFGVVTAGPDAWVLGSNAAEGATSFGAIGAGSGIALAKLKRTILVEGNINVFRQHLWYLNKCSIK